MKGLWLALALSGCTVHPHEHLPSVVKVTEYRAVQDACEPFEEQLRRMTEDRNRWKSYANKLEKLP